ncbi:threonine--tRNA ligase [Candidatus Woesearchaeota archaeon]|nr:threonine--tRNA ligase [Candidatus Woesearchaeota archaeon]
MKVTITFPDGSKKQFDSGITAMEIAKSIAEGLARNAFAAKVDDKLIDLSTSITKSCSIRILTWKDKEGIDIFRHSSAHLLAHAVHELFPYAKPTIGPVTEEGFYYDFDHDPFTPQDLEKIEKKMEEIASRKLPIQRMMLTEKQAVELFKDNKYKVEIIKSKDTGEVGKEEITAYKQGDFLDLCRGPHIPNTSLIKAVKLTKLAGAYWRGDQKYKQLQRIYVISFPEKKFLTEHLQRLEEAEKRDHRKLGKELELFMFHEWSPGSPILLPKGTIIYNELLSFLREEYRKRGYQEVITPQLFNKALWETSGHWSHFKQDMFVFNVEEEEFSLKPMNCPSHVLIYKSQLRSYRDLPLRLADFCFLHRNELRGVLGGMTRVRKMSQDDAHVFCTPEQINAEIEKLLDFIRYVYIDVFSFTFHAKLSTRPQEFMGDSKVWDKAEKALEDSLKKTKLPYEIKKGEGAFYGPKIDFDVKDALGRDWQLATIQLDFQMPLRFGAEYEGADGKRHAVVMIHRAILGSLERFLGVMVEHYAGKFPLWLSPVHVKILTVADRHKDYAEQVCKQFFDAGLRVAIDDRSESIPKKVREAQLEQVNYILVVGDQEIKNKTVTVRTRNNEVVGEKKVDELVKALQREVAEKK